LNLERYIIVSMFMHALLFWALGTILPGAATSPLVFNVKILPPMQEKAPTPPNRQEQTQTTKKPEEKRKIILPKRHRRPPVKNVVPDAMKGGDSHARVSSGPVSKKEKSDRTSDKDEKFDKESHPYVLPPSALFDRRTIEKFARKGTPPVDRGLTFDTAEFRHRGYMRMLRERIEDVWQYPGEAAKRGISGDLYIKFVINRDGHLTDIKLLRTSGYRLLDEAAMNALKNAEPYWPLPEDWDKDTLEIKGHFIYVFGRTFVM
jgi:protein TonB